MSKLLDRRRFTGGSLLRSRPTGPGRVPAQGRPDVKGIRRRRPKDLGACGRLLEVVYYDAHYPAFRPDSPRAWLDDRDVYDAWVAERQGEILGHVAISAVGRDGLSALRWRETTGHLPSDLLAVSRFFVRPRVRGQGIGTALLDTAAAEIRRRGRVPVLEMISARRDGIPYLGNRHWRLIAIDAWGPREQNLHICRYAGPVDSIPR